MSHNLFYSPNNYKQGKQGPVVFKTPYTKPINVYGEPLISFKPFPPMRDDIPNSAEMSTRELLRELSRTPSERQQMAASTHSGRFPRLQQME